MPDERESAHPPPPRDAASETRIQSGGPERYPAVNQTDAVELAGRSGWVAGERRSFDPAADAPTPRRGAGDAASDETDLGRLGPAGDPAEGKR